ncbi:MAG: Spo0E like sporulation regulatory protein [Bacillales bacterium]|nr:Spo0E like sporulation regulatory protein [Bacillales bacterium]
MIRFGILTHQYIIERRIQCKQKIMYTYAEVFGLQHERTIEISQQIDKLHMEHQKLSLKLSKYRGKELEVFGMKVKNTSKYVFYNLIRNIFL